MQSQAVAPQTPLHGAFLLELTMKHYCVVLEKYGIKQVAFTYSEKEWADNAVARHSANFPDYKLYVEEKTS